MRQLQRADLPPNTRITKLNTLAWAIRRTDVPEAIRFAKEAYQLALIENDMEALAICNGHMARFYHYENKIQMALNYANAALALFDEIQIYNEAYQQTLHTLASVYQDLGNYKDAFELYIRLLDIAQDNNNLYCQCIAYNGLAGIHSRFGNREDALENYERCREICDKNNDYYMLGVVHRNLAMEYEFLNQYMVALEYAEEAINYFEAVQSEDQIHAVKLIISGIYLQMHDYARADEILHRAWRMLSQDENYRRKFGIEILLKLSKLEIAQSNYESALIYVHDAYEQALANDRTEHIYKCHEQFAFIYKKQGDFKLALYHFEQFHKRRDEVLNHDQLSAIHNFNILHQTERARKETDFYKRLRDQELKHHEYIMQMKDELLHTASHDLKNPLMTMISYLHLLEKHLLAPDDETMRYLDVIKSQVEQMRKLIVDVLDLAVLETEVRPEDGASELKSVLQNTYSMFMPQIEARQQSLKWDDPDYDIFVAIDDIRLKQILHNLLSNAIKYTPKGGTISIDAHCNGNNTVVVKIKDTGWGIPDEDMPYIFEKFYRSNSSETVNEDGTGLGLAIVKRILEQYSGTIDVYSKVGQGSEFTVSLPLSNNHYIS